MAGNPEQREAARQLSRRHVTLTSVSAKRASDTKRRLLKPNLSLQLKISVSLSSIENNKMFICIGTDLKKEIVWPNGATVLYEAILLLASLG